MFAITVCFTSSGKAYYCSIVSPDGMVTSATLESRAECWKLAESTMNRYAIDLARKIK